MGSVIDLAKMSVIRAGHRSESDAHVLGQLRLRLPGIMKSKFKISIGNFEALDER